MLHCYGDCTIKTGKEIRDNSEEPDDFMVTKGHCTMSPELSHVKKKYDLTLCQLHLQTAFETFSIMKIFESGSIFCGFASFRILIGKDEEYEKRTTVQ